MAIFSNSIIPAGVAAADDDVVTKSLRFDADARLSSPAFGTSSSDQKKKTLSFWVKRCELNDSGGQPILEFINGSGTTDGGSMIFSGAGGGGSSVNDDFMISNRNASYGVGDYQIRTTGLFRDVAAWYHFCIKYDTTNATAADRVQIWVNGKRVTALNMGDTVYPPLNYVTTSFLAPSTASHTMGYGTGMGSANYLGGYLADFYYIDGVACDATAFAEEDATTGQWKPKAFVGVYGDNGFHLPFDSEDGQVFAIQSDAADGNTTFTDLSQHTHAITASGNTEHSTDVSDPAGGSKSSMYFDGTTSGYFSSTDAKDVANFDNSDWTLEYWVRPSSAYGSADITFLGSGGGAAAWNGTNGHSWTMWTNSTQGDIYFQYWTGSTYTEVTHSNTDVPVNTWTHIAVVNQAGTKRMYIGGVQRDTNSTAKTAISTPSVFIVGNDPSTGGPFEGYIHNVSIQRDFCKYKDGTTFTPSTSPVTALSADIGFDTSVDTYLTATGGTVTTDGDYKVHTFNSTGTFEVTNTTNATVEYLVIAGGGGGGGNGGGGGGAGGYLTATGLSVAKQSYTVTVGAGGAKGAHSGATGHEGANGTDSTISTVTSTGGGGGSGTTASGSAANNLGHDGGSGGGGGPFGSGGSGVSGQGYDGGSGTDNGGY